MPSRPRRVSVTVEVEPCAGAFTWRLRSVRSDRTVSPSWTLTDFHPTSAGARCTASLMAEEWGYTVVTDLHGT